VKSAWLIEHHADSEIIQWIRHFIEKWEKGLRSDAGLEGLYGQESFRSYILDVEDDLSGKSCTAATVKKISCVLDMIRTEFAFLRESGSLFWGDEKLERQQLLEKYVEMEMQVGMHQLS